MIHFGVGDNENNPRLSIVGLDLICVGWSLDLIATAGPHQQGSRFLAGACCVETFPSPCLIVRSTYQLLILGKLQSLRTKLVEAVAYTTGNPCTSNR